MKEYTIIMRRYGRNGERESRFTGTLEELTDKFSYTLERGWSWQNERGNKKIDRHPKTVRSLVKNLNNAENNAAVNGYSGTTYELAEV